MFVLKTTQAKENMTLQDVWLFEGHTMKINVKYQI
jgi:hypothetical protein